jgi:hypothetical protein
MFIERTQRNTFKVNFKGKIIWKSKKTIQQSNLKFVLNTQTHTQTKKNTKSKDLASLQASSISDFVNTNFVVSGGIIPVLNANRATFSVLTRALCSITTRISPRTSFSTGNMIFCWLDWNCLKESFQKKITTWFRKKQSEQTKKRTKYFSGLWLFIRLVQIKFCFG